MLGIVFAFRTDDHEIANPEEVWIMTTTSHEVTIPAGAHEIQGTMTMPPDSRGIVIFAHGSGSSRYSPRNRFVAEALNKASFATLLMDLLDEAEAENRENVFDISLLAERVVAA